MWCSQIHRNKYTFKLVWKTFNILQKDNSINFTMLQKFSKSVVKYRSYSKMKVKREFWRNLGTSFTKKNNFIVQLTKLKYYYKSCFAKGFGMKLYRLFVNTLKFRNFGEISILGYKCTPRKRLRIEKVTKAF